MNRNRSEFNAHADMKAGVRAPVRRVISKPRAVLPVSRVAKWAAVIVAAVIAAPYVVEFVRGII